MTAIAPRPLSPAMPLAGDQVAGEASANVSASPRAALGLRAAASPCGRFAPRARAR